MLAKTFNIHGDSYFLQNVTAEINTKKRLTVVTKNHVNTAQYPKSGIFQESDVRLKLKF